jgi:hypoxanthine phosphoribosyltransferase
MKNIENIYGVPRGGLVVAVYISHLLDDLPIVLRATDTDRGKTLIVDDIADTGKTLRKFTGYKIATIYYHKQSIIKPDIWIYQKVRQWIVFPWEKDGC